jgi:hypothetical protein
MATATGLGSGAATTTKGPLLPELIPADTGSVEMSISVRRVMVFMGLVECAPWDRENVFCI